LPVKLKNCDQTRLTWGEPFQLQLVQLVTVFGFELHALHDAVGMGRSWGAAPPLGGANERKFAQLEPAASTQ
jgi:hypothetical protein